MEYVINAQGEKLGRLASRIAVILQGKLNPSYEPRLPGVDRVVVKNAKKIEVTGSKEREKIYYRHTGYMGHLRERRFREAFEASPEAVLRQTVSHMLPKNRLRGGRLKRLIIER